MSQLRAMLLCVVDSWYDINIVWWEHMIYISIHFEPNEQDKLSWNREKLHEI